jgi:hypothetical protein
MRFSGKATCINYLLLGSVYIHCFLTCSFWQRFHPIWLLVVHGGIMSATYLWSAWDSKRIRLQRTGRCHRAATWRSCARRGHGLDTTAQPSRSSGQTASTLSGCECGRTDSSQGPAGRRSGRAPLKQKDFHENYFLSEFKIRVQNTAKY